MADERTKPVEACGELRSSHGRLLLNGAFLDEEVADLLGVLRGPYGGLEPLRLASIRIAVTPPSPVA